MIRWAIKYWCNSPKGGFIAAESISYTRREAWEKAVAMWGADSAALRRQRRNKSTRAVRVEIKEQPHDR